MQRPRITTKSLYRWIRELHLYFGIFITPYVLLFAISAILFSHPWDPGDAELDVKVQERSSIEIPENVESLELAQQIMRQVGVSGEIEFFRHSPQQKRLVIPVMKPGQRITIIVDVQSKTAKIEQRNISFRETLLYLHKSPGPHLAGFRGNWFYTRLWRWLADATVYLVLFVSVSGIYMWTVLKTERKIGLILLGAGCLTFFLMVFAMAG